MAAVADTAIDSLTSATLKNLRERWWNDEFTEFLVETLKPRPGNRILDVGCGEGVGEVSIGRQHLSQIRLVGIDLSVKKVQIARQTTSAHNQRVLLAAGDAVRLPFRDGVFDSTYCVAVLQHVPDVEAAIAEFSRVTREHGRIVAVEPDNVDRYAYSSVPEGAQAFAHAARLFAAAAAERQVPVGPRLAELFSRHGVEPVGVRLFPVSLTLLGAPGPDLWLSRRRAIETLATNAAPSVRALAATGLELMAAYQAAAVKAGAGFVEIQNTTLFATVGQKRES